MSSLVTVVSEMHGVVQVYSRMVSTRVSMVLSRALIGGRPLTQKSHLYDIPYLTLNQYDFFNASHL